jgi:hypothetical protein
MARTDVLRATALHSPSRWVIEIGTHHPKRILHTSLATVTPTR